MKTSIIILIVIVILILAAVTIFSRTINTSNRILDMPPKPSIEYLITHLNATSPLAWDQVDEAILGMSGEPEMIAALSAAAAGEDIFAAIHANYLLFRLRNDPVDRLSALFTYLRDGPRGSAEALALRIVFLGKFGPQDIGYLPEFKQLKETDDYFVANLADEAIKNITASAE